jgi:hypothetical protein
MFASMTFHEGRNRQEKLLLNHYAEGERQKTLSKERTMRHRGNHSVFSTIAVWGLATAFISSGMIVHAEAPVDEAGHDQRYPPAEFWCGDPQIAGQHPAGCVSCHNGGEAGTVGELLAAMGHRNVDGQTETVPDDCAVCHSEEGGYSTLKEFSHVVHYDKPARNDFLRDYGGNCLHCHALDARTGDVITKSGPKNW